MITAEFDNFSFHDATVSNVNRKPNSISIVFENAFMSKGHSESEDKDWNIDSGVLHLSNVSKELALFWYDNIEGKPHPEPELPLDVIMNLDFDGKIFKFGGFLNNEPWAEWQVYATEFKIEINSRHVVHS
jgi:hypothetical protein